MTAEVFDRWYEASRAASGVPAKIEDPAVLARVATLAFAGADQGDGAGSQDARRRRRQLIVPPTEPAAQASRRSDES
jgi:hypothetical protein